MAAIVGSNSDPERLIHLGADEVIRADVETPSDWIPIISDLIEIEKRVRLLIFPSNIISNVISGALYYRQMKRVGAFLDQADFVEGTSGSKRFAVNLAIQKGFAEEKVNIVSINTLTAAPPFEDSSRFGKTREYQKKNGATTNFLMERVPQNPVNSSQEITVIAGDECVYESARKLAEKFHSRFLKYSGSIEIVYGPCIAVEVYGKLRLLPEFKGDLISLNRKATPINAISDVEVVNSDLDNILDDIR